MKALRLFEVEQDFDMNDLRGLCVRCLNLVPLDALRDLGAQNVAAVATLANVRFLNSGETSVLYLHLPISVSCSASDENACTRPSDDY